MTTLAKLCLVLTVVLGLAFAEPLPKWFKKQAFKTLDTGDKCRAIETACSHDHECCSNRCQLKCQKSKGGKCERRCADCKHRNDICRTNGDCCSQKCAPDRFDPSKYTCTDEEEWVLHAAGAEHSPQKDEGETVSLASRSASGIQEVPDKEDLEDGEEVAMSKSGPKNGAGGELPLVEEDGEEVAMSKSGPKNGAGGELPLVEEDVEEPGPMSGPKDPQAEEEIPYVEEEDDAMTGAPSAKETLGKLLKAVFKRLSSGKGIKMTVDVKNPEAVIGSLAE